MLLLSSIDVSEDTMYANATTTVNLHFKAYIAALRGEGLTNVARVKMVQFTAHLFDVFFNRIMWEYK